jgi:hypothetical protein
MPGQLMWPLGAALAHAAAGRRDAANIELAAISLADLRAIPRATLWTGYVSGTARLADLCNRRDLAAFVLDQLAPLTARHIVMGGMAYRGSVAHWQGVGLRVLGDLDAAESRLRQALAEHDALASPPWQAETATALAQLLMSRAAPGDTDEAAGLLGIARRLADQCGMKPLQARCAAIASS